ncbi:unnamed protein product [Cylicocyclus nassatus]|uniref:GATOR complex protein NPRL3 n=1 Tax=Cylicocyclus nassatus TaxID=53992 RepID=A0AA36GZ60_CYLNA|nr:unnamed protein product [Cylicocyclus nassatus]
MVTPSDNEDIGKAIPMGILLATKGTAGDRLLFLYPPSPSNSQKSESRAKPLVDSISKTDRDCKLKTCTAPTSAAQLPILMTMQNAKKSGEMSFPTQFILSTCMLANILSVKDSVVDAPFELKVDNVRFAGHPKKLTRASEGSSTIFSIVFVLPASVNSHLVESFQSLSKKLALAIDSLQTQRGYFAEQERIMRSALDEFEAEVSSRPESDQSFLNIPWDTIRGKSALAELLTKVFTDVGRTGVVQVFVDNFIEVGFCVQSRALAHAHLTPKNRAEIDRIVKQIRPYHGILLLEDVWPSPDANPSVTLLLKHCEPDRSILDMSTASGIPLLQVFLIVRHLLLWARAVVIYPLCNTNIYSSATLPKPLRRYVTLFSQQFGPSFHLADALAQFDPPSTLGDYLNANQPLADQQNKAKVIVALLRHQLIMQLHRYCYIVPPFSDAKLPRAGHHCPDSLKSEICACDDIEDAIKPIISDLCGSLLDTQSFSSVEGKLHLFLRMSRFMHGQHHIEDIVYRLNVERSAIEDVLATFSLVLCSFLRPDFISE